MTSTIDWGGQLEAYHEDGWVYPAVFKDDDGTTDLPVLVDIPLAGIFGFWAQRDGQIDSTHWRIRNTPQAPTEAPQATPPILPSTEQLDRFEALLMRLEGILGGINKGEEA